MGRRSHRATPAGRDRVTTALNLTLTGAIITLDWVTTAGVVVSFLLCLPIVVASLSDRRGIWLIFGVSIVGFVAAAVFGAPPIAPREVWLPNRVVGFLALPAAAIVAFALQRRRLEAVRAGEEALAARDVARHMTSIVAHDLRAPLGLAVETLELLRQEASRPGADQDRLLSEVEARLRRGLAAADATLALARDHLAESRPVTGPILITEVDIESVLADEAGNFAEQAKEAGKAIIVDAGSVGTRQLTITATVLRQVLRILIDNALKYSNPGEVRIVGSAVPPLLIVRVQDAGPSRATPPSAVRGAGMGLELCRVLLHRGNGQLVQSARENDRTAFDILLPCGPTSAPSARGDTTV